MTCTRTRRLYGTGRKVAKFTVVVANKNLGGWPDTTTAWTRHLKENCFSLNFPSPSWSGSLRSLVWQSSRQVRISQDCTLLNMNASISNSSCHFFRGLQGFRNTRALGMMFWSKMAIAFTSASASKPQYKYIFVWVIGNCRKCLRLISELQIWVLSGITKEILYYLSFNLLNVVVT